MKKHLSPSGLEVLLYIAAPEIRGFPRRQMLMRAYSIAYETTLDTSRNFYAVVRFGIYQYIPEC